LLPDVVEPFQEGGQAHALLQAVVGDDAVMFREDLPAAVDVCVRACIVGGGDPASFVQAFSLLVARDAVAADPAEAGVPDLAGSSFIGFEGGEPASILVYVAEGTAGLRVVWVLVQGLPGELPGETGLVLLESRSGEIPEPFGLGAAEFPESFERRRAVGRLAVGRVFWEHGQEKIGRSWRGPRGDAVGQLRLAGRAAFSGEGF
jgi:hypothetical protein